MTQAPTASRSRSAQGGATLIEVLVSLVILMVGLLGLVGVMIQSQRAQVESYQRVQALRARVMGVYHARTAAPHVRVIGG